MVTVSRSNHAVGLSWPSGQRPPDSVLSMVLHAANVFGFLLQRGEAISSKALAIRIAQHYDVANPQTAASVRALTDA